MKPCCSAVAMKKRQYYSGRKSAQDHSCSCSICSEQVSDLEGLACIKKWAVRSRCYLGRLPGCRYGSSYVYGWHYADGDSASWSGISGGIKQKLSLTTALQRLLVGVAACCRCL